ncbi:MAG: hypothetical protein U0236_13840 [Nitrospira sp.]
MTSATIPHEFRTTLRNGWLGSIALHGLLLLSFFPLFHKSVTTIPKELFRWDVTLVESTRTVDEPAQVVDTVKPTMTSHPKQTPVPVHPIRTVRQAAPSADRIVPIEPSTTEPIAPASQPNIASSVASPNEPTTASISDNARPNQPQMNDPRPQQTDIPTNSLTTEPSTTRTGATTSNEGTERTTEPTQPVQPPSAVSDTEVASAARPDYRWLQQAIFRRLEKLKRLSHPYVGQSQPMKVMVKAVVSREGILLDSMVVKSSGLDRIDQEAMTLVQRAFPMQLDRTLDRQQIVMRIPITYSQE